MNNWYTVKVKYTKQLEDGTFKRVSEPYLVAAMSFSDAETRIFEELGMSIRGEFDVTGISKTDIHEIFYYDDADVWYKCKITYEAASDNVEDGGKAKKISQNILVSAHSVKESYERLKESLKGMMMDYTIPSIIISPLIDIFPFTDGAEGSAAGKELEKQLKKDVAAAVKAEQEHSLGRKTVFSASGSDEDEDFGDDEDSIVDDQFGEEE